MPGGGRRRGAGAPRGNYNALKSGAYSPRVRTVLGALLINDDTREVLLELGRKGRMHRGQARNLALVLARFMHDRPVAEEAKRRVYALADDITEQRRAAAMQAAIDRHHAETGIDPITDRARRPGARRRRPPPAALILLEGARQLRKEIEEMDDGPASFADLSREQQDALLALSPEKLDELRHLSSEELDGLDGLSLAEQEALAGLSPEDLAELRQLTPEERDEYNGVFVFRSVLDGKPWPSPRPAGWQQGATAGTLPRDLDP